MATRNDAYTAARLASEDVLTRAIQAADAIAANTIAAAKVAWRKGNTTADERDAAMCAASAVRAAAYAEAEQQHRDRLAAIQRRQQVTSVEIAYNGVRRQVRVDANGRVVAENPVFDDGW